MTLPDSSRVHPLITVGRAPERFGDLLGTYQVVVSCIATDEPAPAGHEWRHIACPLTDDAFEIRPGDWRRACDAAARVTRHVKNGHAVYIYCREGLNRSALVAALAVRELTGTTGAEAVATLQLHRAGSLYNWHFRSALDTLGVPTVPLDRLPQPVVKR